MGMCEWSSQLVRNKISIPLCTDVWKESVTFHVMDELYVCMYEICFYSCLLSYYMLINVDYTITYFLPIPSTVPRTRASILSCSTSLSYRPVSSFIQLYLYRLLAATNSGSLLSFDPYVDLVSQTRTHLVGSLVGHRSVDIYRVSSFFRWVWSVRPFSTPTVASILWLRIKTPPRPFGANMVAWWLPWGDCGSHWCGSFFRLTYCAEATDSP